MRSDCIRRPNHIDDVRPCIHCHKRRGWRSGGLCTRCYADDSIRTLHGIIRYPASLTTEERFWLKVDKSGECWEWRAGLGRGGYGKFSGPYGFKPAHRVAWEFAHGPIGNPKMLVCHKCDNRLCVRLDHLFLGDHLANSQDAQRKGRLCSGDRHPSRIDSSYLCRGSKSPVAILNEDKVREILRRSNEPASALAAEFGVSHSAIRLIVRRINWKHVTM